jgi:hypothetical protein
MCDKALSRAALELTQKIQMHFPSDIDPEVVQAWNGCPANIITEQLKAAFGHNPNSGKPVVEVKAPAKAKPALLEAVGTVSILATTDTFVAKNRFVVNTKHNAQVLISGLGDNFTEWFLLGVGKTEDPITEQALRYLKLRKFSLDGPIIEELGGEAKAETTLSEMFSLMEKQKLGEDGVLLNNGYANIFYIKDQNGVLRAVSVYWHDDGWYVDATSFEDPDGWSDGIQVVSRNSALESSATAAA